MDSLGEGVEFDPAPVDLADHLDVQPVRLDGGQIRVVVTDVRCGLKLITLDAEDAATLGGWLFLAAARIRGVIGTAGHDPGE